MYGLRIFLVSGGKMYVGQRLLASTFQYIRSQHPNDMRQTCSQYLTKSGNTRNRDLLFEGLVFGLLHGPISKPSPSSDCISSRLTPPGRKGACAEAMLDRTSKVFVGQGVGGKELHFMGVGGVTRKSGRT